MQPKEVLEFAKEKRVQMVDVKFVDLFGIWQHFTMPVGELEEGLFEDGLGFDGSSIRGWQAINASDMLVIPEAGTIGLLAMGLGGLTISRRRRRSC